MQSPPCEYQLDIEIFHLWPSASDLHSIQTWYHSIQQLHSETLAGIGNDLFVHARAAKVETCPTNIVEHNCRAKISIETILPVPRQSDAKGNSMCWEPLEFKRQCVLSRYHM